MGFDYPFVGLINHFNELCDNFVARVVESLKGLLINVPDARMQFRYVPASHSLRFQRH